MNLVTINTYAGSLLLGAKAYGAKLLGSYEDGGFGQGIAEANFPEVEHIKQERDWPKDSLKDTVVLAHPPCSAFSVQNSSWNARGANSDAFACTRRVLDYALPLKAQAVAIESVVGALGGAWEVHQAYADHNDYDLYRVLQNGCAFGVPQWRDRFWVVYVRRPAPRGLRVRLAPKWTTVKDAIDGYEEGPGAGNTDELLVKLKEKLGKRLSKKNMIWLFETKHPTEGIAKTLLKHRELLQLDLGDIDPINDAQRLYIGNSFSSGQLCFVDPDSLVGTLLGSSWWYANGRNLSETCYKRLMGFPADYIFPEGRGNYRKGMRTFLSKGVIPHVAQWIVELIGNHLGERTFKENGPAWDLTIQPNEIADLRFKRARWMKDELPPLRHFTEEE